MTIFKSSLFIATLLTVTLAAEARNSATKKSNGRVNKSPYASSSKSVWLAPVIKPPVTSQPETAQQPPAVSQPVSSPVAPASQRVCSQYLHQALTLSSQSKQVPYFVDKMLELPEGKVVAIQGDGRTAYLVCIFDTVKTTGAEFNYIKFKGYSNDLYVPSQDPNACNESLHSLLRRIGSTKSKYISQFNDRVYTVSSQDVPVTIHGKYGHTLRLECKSDGFASPFIAEPN